MIHFCCVLGDTASNLGNAMDELMRHQPSLRTDATKAIIKVKFLLEWSLCLGHVKILPVTSGQLMAFLYELSIC